jgi:hypothetical protein
MAGLDGATAGPLSCWLGWASGVPGLVDGAAALTDADGDAGTVGEGVADGGCTWWWAAAVSWVPTGRSAACPFPKQPLAVPVRTPSRIALLPNRCNRSIGPSSRGRHGSTRRRAGCR